MPDYFCLGTYKELQTILRQRKTPTFAALFCLYAAEWWRRN
jgi:hypothetical protein